MPLENCDLRLKMPAENKEMNIKKKQLCPIMLITQRVLN